MNRILLTASAIACASFAHAGLIDTQYDLFPNASGFAQDNNAQAGEYSANYNNGSGGGFGGTLGGATLRMDADASNMYFGLTPGNNLNDVVIIYLDTKAGGFTDATMSDNSDGSRNAVSNLAVNANDNFPVGFEADYAVVIAGFGALSFELTGTSHNYMGNFIASREVAVDRAALGLTGNNFGFNWFAAYCSESGYNSDEAMPGPGFGGGNPGFDNGTNYDNWNRFQAVPEPASMTALGLGLLAVVRRRRSK